MIHLITLLISLLGYGTPEDFSNWTEEEITTEIQAQQDGRGGEWELPNYTQE